MSNILSYSLYAFNCFLVYIKMSDIKISTPTTYKSLANDPKYIWLGILRVPFQYLGVELMNISILCFMFESIVYYYTFNGVGYADYIMFYCSVMVSFISKFCENNIFSFVSQNTQASYYAKKLYRGEKILIVGGGPATNILTLLKAINYKLKNSRRYQFKSTLSDYSDKVTIFAQQFTIYPDMNLTGQQVNTSCDEESAFELVRFCEEQNLKPIFIGTTANKWNDKSVNVRTVKDWSNIMNDHHRNILKKQFQFVGPAYATSGIMFDPVTYLFALNYMGIDTGFLPKTCQVYAYLDDEMNVRISKDNSIDNSYCITMMKPLWEQPDNIVNIMTDKFDKSEDVNDYVSIRNDSIEYPSQKLDTIITTVINGEYKLPEDVNVITIGDAITGDLDDIIMYLCALGSTNNKVSIIYTTAPCDPHHQVSFNLMPKDMAIKNYLTTYQKYPSSVLGYVRGYNLAKELFYIFEDEVKKNSIRITSGSKQAKKHPFGGLASFHCDKRTITDFENMILNISNISQVYLGTNSLHKED